MAGFAFPKSFQVSGMSGTPTFVNGSAPTTPNVVQVLLSQSVLSGERFDFYQLLVSCSMSGKIVVKKDGSPILTGRTSPSEKNVSLNWFPGYPITGPGTVTVEFTARVGTPIVDIEACLMSLKQS